MKKNILIILAALLYLFSVSKVFAQESCSCQVGQACSLWDGSTSWAGECAADWGGGSGTLIPCGCSTNYGVYIPTSVQSHCCA